MSYDTERSVIEAYLQDNWGSIYPSMQIGFDRHNFTPPQDADSIRLTIVSGEAEQISLGVRGTNLIRHTGLIMLQIFCVGNSKSNSAREIADYLSDLFMNRDLSTSLRTRVPYVVGMAEEPPFLMWTLGVPFERDEFNG